MESNVPPNDPQTPPPFTSAPPVIKSSRFTESPAPKKPRGWKIFAFILLALLVVSVLLNASHFVNSLVDEGLGHGHATGPKLEEVVVEDNDAKDKIAVIHVDGIIASETESGYDLVDTIKEQLKRADDDDKVKAVVLKVNSPGGEVLASDEIYKLIADFQRDDTNHVGKPVVASMGSLAASGGYYISAPCRWIVANELTITGSIGVIMHGYNFRGLMDKIGVRPDVYKSGKFKNMLSPDRSDAEIPPEERAMVQSLIDETYQKFKSVVAEGRSNAHKLNKKDGHELRSDWQDFADGRVVSGKQALQLGLVDELGNFDVAADRAIDLAGISTANIIEYQEKRDLADLLHLFGKSEAKSIKVDLGVNFPKLHAGYLYFLAPTFVQ